ncbi:hypothetical protein Cci01nite_47080 [Catellatospora citrea]|uniref:Haloacid dehalogenase-like hydrolase n=1 Tax=Catellatospora citrea TaxID=53366 RepID=A0A8J3KFE7_9ACTN|nr:hypothetical protein [Catellatospora citrea]GIF99614.1 hypothetical protein Cci01nite_47080 [Catellatospora citrea]
MTTPSLLVLWDVDGTLIHNDGVSKQAYALGFELLTDLVPTEPVITDGMADTAITRSLFERHGLVLTTELAVRTLEVLLPRGQLRPELRPQDHRLGPTRSNRQTKTAPHAGGERFRCQSRLTESNR